ncbi:hypothetical protein MO973_05390 [Paenibacillus sp. TRM 82003]|nr:hypothetical protein [Paenibacillus sp. TRM 82003]
MNIIIAVVLLGLAIRFGKWKRWQAFYPTLLYIVVCNLFYNYIVKEQHLWKFESPWFPFPHEVMDVIYSFIINPAMTYLFLSYHPTTGWVRKSAYWLGWTVVFSLIETLQFLTDHIVYYRGWSIPWTVFFYTLMFPMLYLHYRKPIIALLLSIPATLGYMWIFNYI